MLVHQVPGEEAIALQVWNTAQRMGRAFDGRLAAAGGTRAQFFVLVAIDRIGEPSQRDLARAVGVDDATITHHLAAMERDGLIARSRDTTDRRILRVAITAAGRARWRALEAATDAYNAEQFAGMGPEEVAALGDLLRRLDVNSERVAHAVEGPSTTDRPDPARGSG